MESVESELKAIKESTAMSRIIADMAEKADRNNKRLLISNIVQSVIIVVLICALLFVAINGQKSLDEAVWKSLNAAGEVTTTTTTVEQDTGEGGGNAVYQAGEHATYTESGAEQ